MNTATSTRKSNKEKQILKIATWNLQGLNKEGKLKELDNYDIDILALQERSTKGTAITIDFNDKIGKEERNNEVVGKESLHRKSNKNGQRLIDLAAVNRMIIKSTHLKHKDIHKPTWNLKEEKKGFQPRTVALKNYQGEICVDTTSMLNILEHFFKNTLTNNECETEKEQLHQNYQNKQKLKEPTKKEKIEIIKKSKNNKSPGEDGIAIEQIKYSSK
ncbi:hypothetical protein ILUMI_19561 [Ignelater luminosus]|uniref:Endonuclease/exonuclease/phosphatase domain-containing protein n=1 Tax=Ignelater luminosus TaxID=2038154 RepID=A0A8K0CM63_IGNLU|nr:hypothetical protein ILUMI_19561 [Ignelater luminosus]